jgi:acyl-CoA thioester hydrolase
VSGAPVEVWRGCANAWECDHIGHLNTRHYLARIEQSLAVFARLLGLTGNHRLIVKAQHMRFLHEARAGTALHATAQVLSWGRDEADVLFVIHHSVSGQVAATFRLTLACVEPWPAQATRVASSLRCEAPNEARPRSVSLEGVEITASLERARQMGLRTTGLGAITADACDANGNWKLSAFMGRVADSIPHLRNGDWRQVLASTAPGSPARVSSALIEFHAVHVRWPRIGDVCEVRSALAGCTERVTYSSHWLLDPQTGEPWAAVRTVGIALDLDARRSIPLTAEAQAAYRAASVLGLSF